MKTKTIEEVFFVMPNTPLGYGIMADLIDDLSDESIWNKICDILRRYPHHRYLKHFVRTRWEPTDTPIYVPPINPSLEIPTGNYVYTLKLILEDTRDCDGFEES